MRKIIFTILLNTFLMPQLVFGHARLKNTVFSDGQVLQPRNTLDGIKTGPCGGYPRTAGTILKPGQTIQVNWEETIDHPGYYRVYFSSANESSFQMLAEIQDTATGPTPHPFSTMVTLPNVTCDQCTLQLIQYMTENPAAPSLYYSCADIRLTNASSTSNAPTSAPTSEEILRGCGATKVASINASLSFALSLPVFGLMRKRKKK